MPTGLKLRDWDNPPDPQRPALPYRDKLTLSIQQHIPPEPYGYGYVEGYQKGKREKLAKWFQSEWCLECPVEDTPHPDQTMHRLHIIDEVSCKDGRGAQLVRCSLDEDEGQIYVAKIYDPLYYSYVDKETGLPADPTWEADHDYGREAAAYEELKKSDPDGTLAPIYFGSWTFNMTLGDVERPVRMILIEWVQGVSMMSLILSHDVLRLTPELRLEIFARTLEIRTKLLFHNVAQRDFAPRNVILVGLDYQAQTVDKVLLIDFNKSIVFTQRYCRMTNYDMDLPISPRYHYWGPCPSDFFYWLPQPHRSREKVFKGWLKTRFGNPGEYAGPTDALEEVYDFDEPVEMAPPEQDDELPNFIVVDYPVYQL